MISNDSLIRSLHVVIRKKNISDNEKILVSVLLYKTVYNILKNSDILTVGSLISSYYENMYALLISYKNTRLSYSSANDYIEQYKITSVADLNIIHINALYNILNQTTEKVELSTTYFDPKMYGIKSLPQKQYSYLKYVHENIVKKIYAYYKLYNDININNINIISANSAKNNIGKILIFNIDGINSIDIINNIELDNIKIPYISIEISNNNVKLMTK